MEQNNKESMLLIPKRVYEENLISDYALAVYCVLQKLSVHTNIKFQCVSLQQIIYYLTGEIPERKNRIYSYIEQGIEELCLNDCIKIDSIQQKHYLLDCSGLWIDTSSDRFSIVSFNEVQQIFQINGVNKYRLLHFFILLMGSLMASVTISPPNLISKSSVVTNLPISYFSEKMQVSEKTIITYIQALENDKLVYAFREDDFVLNDNNSIKRLKNVYGRYCDKEYVNHYANTQQQLKKSYYYTSQTQMNANQKRRLAQMYQNLCKNKFSNYSKEDVMDIYDYVISENNKYKELYKKTQYDEYLKKIRSVEVFKKFKYLK